jgi:lysophospholipase L1-like esterase
MYKLFLIAFVFVGSCAAQCGPGQTRKPIGNGQYSCVNSPAGTPNTGAMSFNDLATGSTLTVFGDSISTGYGLSSPTTKGYAYQLATEKSWTITNRAQIGDMCFDFAIRPMLETQTTSSTSLTMIGYNDMRVIGTNTAKQLDYQKCLAAGLAWQGIPSSAKVIAQAASGVSTTGVWSNSPVYGNNIGKTTTAAGATITFTTPTTGKTVYLWTLIQAGNTSTYTVAIDGITVSTGLTETATLAATENGATYSTVLLRYPGLANTTHSVVVTATAPDGVNGFHVYASAAASDGITVKGPSVYAANIMRMATATYAASVCSPIACNNGSDTAVGQFGALIDQTISDLQSDGLNINLVDITSAWDPNAGQWQSDNVHPNIAGNTTLANAFIAASTRFSQPRSVVPAGIRGNALTPSSCVNAGGTTQAVTGTYADIAGATLTVTRAGTYLVIGQIDYSMAAADASANSVAIAQLMLDGVANTTFLPIYEAGTALVGRISMGGQWILIANNQSILKFQVKKIGGAGASVVNTNNTSICALWMAP